MNSKTPASDADVLFAIKELLCAADRSNEWAEAACLCYVSRLTILDTREEIAATMAHARDDKECGWGSPMTESEQFISAKKEGS